jgi:sec-independent protein translocase protein TatC
MNGELTPEVLPDEQTMVFWDHIGELRDRLVRSVAALFVGTAVTYALRFRLWALAKRPLLAAIAARPALANGEPFAYTDLAEPFMSMMRLSFWTAVVIVSPYIFLQVWKFVEPALRPKERKMATLFVAVTSGCFIAGAMFAYFFMFRTLSNLLMDEAVNAGLRPNLRPSEYLNLFLYTVIGTGISFETPVLFYFLGRLGLVRSRSMLKFWREATIVILFVAGFLTPGDVIATMIIFGAVLLALYFISAGVVFLVEGPAPVDSGVEPI